MKIFSVFACSLLPTCLFSCASLTTPATTTIDEKPVIEIGSTRNPPEDHIVFIPANTEFPIEFSVTGDVFNQPKSSKVMVSFKEKLYLYKYWASLDGKTWVDSHKLLNVGPSGGFDTSGGKVEVKLDLAK